MALMRGDPYIYRNGDQYVIHAGGDVAHLVVASMEELAVMVVAGMTEEEKELAVQRVTMLHGGNFGASEVMERVGLEGAYAQVAASINRMRASREGAADE